LTEKRKEKSKFGGKNGVLEGITSPPQRRKYVLRKKQSRKRSVKVYGKPVAK